MSTEAMEREAETGGDNMFSMVADAFGLNYADVELIATHVSLPLDTSLPREAHRLLMKHRDALHARWDARPYQSGADRISSGDF